MQELKVSHERSREESQNNVRKHVDAQARALRIEMELSTTKGELDRARREIAELARDRADAEARRSRVEGELASERAGFAESEKSLTESLTQHYNLAERASKQASDLAAKLTAANAELDARALRSADDEEAARRQLNEVRAEVANLNSVLAKKEATLRDMGAGGRNDSAKESQRIAGLDAQLRESRAREAELENQLRLASEVVEAQRARANEVSRELMTFVSGQDPLADRLSPGVGSHGVRWLKWKSALTK